MDCGHAGEVLATPLNDGFQLKQLLAGQYLSECPFYLALSDRVLAMQRVQQIVYRVWYQHA